jgi:hypothetical protein
MSDILIDPELLMNNPALNYITLLNNATDPISQNAGDYGPDDEDFPTVLGATATDQLNTSSTCTHKQFGHLVKSHMNLSDQAEAALHNFCMVSSFTLSIYWQSPCFTEPIIH